MSIETLTPFILALISGAGYGLVWWLTSVYDPTKETTPFQIENLAITLVYSAFIGVSLVYAGDPLSKESFLVQIGASAATIAGLQRLIQTLWRMLGLPGWPKTT